MSYAQHVGAMFTFLKAIPSTPSFMEIGVGTGLTLVPLLRKMTSTPAFDAVGIDILERPEFRKELSTVTFGQDHRFVFLLQNSLVALPELLSEGRQFDLILIDGDHNHHTVSRELELADRLATKNGRIVLDDYDGKYATRDMWYAQRPGYNSTEATQPIVGGKQGVRTAVSEFLASHTKWQFTKRYDIACVLDRS